jgi:hypothetical protein
LAPRVGPCGAGGRGDGVNDTRCPGVVRHRIDQGSARSGD